MEDKLTLELLKEVKANAKKWFVIAIIELAVILTIIVSWFLMSYVIPAEDVTTTSTEQIEQDNSNGANNYIGNDGDINNGETKNNKDNN